MLDIILEQLKQDMNYAIQVLGLKGQQARMYALKKANGEIKEGVN